MINRFNKSTLLKKERQIKRKEINWLFTRLWDWNQIVYYNFSFKTDCVYGFTLWSVYVETKSSIQKLLINLRIHEKGIFLTISQLLTYTV